LHRGPRIGPPEGSIGTRSQWNASRDQTPAAVQVSNVIWCYLAIVGKASLRDEIRLCDYGDVRGGEI
jgi:hypothetical protein